MITVEFEDNGQDYLEWDIEGDGLIGVVTDSRPFQDWIWVGKKVLLRSVVVGEKLTAIIDGVPREMIHKIISVTNKPQEKADATRI